MSTFFASISAPTTTAPLASAAVPENIALSTCAWKSLEARAPKQNKSSAQKTIRRWPMKDAIISSVSPVLTILEARSTPRLKNAPDPEFLSPSVVPDTNLSELS